MIYQKNKTRIIKTSLLAIAGATLFVGCSNGLLSSNEKSNDDIQTSQLINEKKAKLEVVGDIPQIKSKINRDVVETSIFIQNTGDEVAKITNIQSLADESISLVFPSTTIEPTTSEVSTSNLFVGGRPIQTLGPKSLSKENEDQVQNQQFCAVDISLKPGESCQITTAFKPSKVGNTSQQILVNYTDLQGNTSSTKEINVDYLGIGDANLVIEAGSQLDIALGVLGDPVIPQIRNVIIKNEGEEVAKEINILSIEHPAFSIEQESNTCVGDLNKGESCSFDIKYSPSSEMSGNLPIEVSYLDNFTAENLTQKGSLSYLATGSVSLKVTPNDSYPLIASVSKPGTAPQVTRKTITVKNEGTKKASNLNITSNNPSYFLITNDNCSVQGLDVGQECTFDATFSPLENILQGSDSKTGNVEYKISYPTKSEKQSKQITIPYVAISAKILNLSSSDLSSTSSISGSLELQTLCEVKSVYGNGKHNIPIIPNFTAGSEIIDSANVLKATDFYIKEGNREILLTDNVPQINQDLILRSPNNYSYCMNSDILKTSGTAAYFATKKSAAERDLRAQIKWINKKGEITTVKTSDSENLKILGKESMQYNPNSMTEYFNISGEGLGHSGATHNNFTLIRFSPNPMKESLSVYRLHVSSQ